MHASVNSARCDDFWDRIAVNRPLIATRVGGWTSDDHYPSGLTSLPNGLLGPKDLHPLAFRSDYEQLYTLHAATGADVPWAAYPPFPMPWLEAIIGCPVVHRDGSIWAGHWLDDYEQLQDLDLTEDNRWLQALLEFTDALVAQSAGRFPVALALMRGPADLLSALRGPERMVLDLFDHPDQVDAALQRLTTIWMQVAELQQERIPAFAGGYAFSVINLWARRPCGWFQDDAVALWSPRFYRRHLQGREEQLSRSLPISGMHLHPSPLFMLDDLLAMPDLDVVEVNLDLNGPPLAQLIPHFQRILEAKCLMVWGEFDEEGYRLMRDRLRTAGLGLQVMAATLGQMQHSVRTLKRVWGAES